MVTLYFFQVRQNTVFFPLFAILMFNRTGGSNIFGRAAAGVVRSRTAVSPSSSFPYFKLREKGDFVGGITEESFDCGKNSILVVFSKEVIFMTSKGAPVGFSDLAGCREQVFVPSGTTFHTFWYAKLIKPILRVFLDVSLVMKR